MHLIQFFGLPNERMLLLLQEPGNTLLAIFGHPGDDVDINARLQGIAKRHSIRLVEQCLS